jgi:hypothetical protein
MAGAGAEDPNEGRVLQVRAGRHLPDAATWRRLTDLADQRNEQLSTLSAGSGAQAGSRGGSRRAGCVKTPLMVRVRNSNRNVVAAYKRLGYADAEVVVPVRFLEPLAPPH